MALVGFFAAFVWKARGFQRIFIISIVMLRCHRNPRVFIESLVIGYRLLAQSWLKRHTVVRNLVNRRLSFSQECCALAVHRTIRVYKKASTAGVLSRPGGGYFSLAFDGRSMSQPRPLCYRRTFIDIEAEPCMKLLRCNSVPPARRAGEDDDVQVGLKGT